MTRSHQPRPAFEISTRGGKRLHRASPVCSLLVTARENGEVRQMGQTEASLWLRENWRRARCSRCQPPAPLRMVLG